jgi:hypothetical protein
VTLRRLFDQAAEGDPEMSPNPVMIWTCMSWKEAVFACGIEGEMDVNLFS